MGERLRKILLIHPRFQLAVLGFGFLVSFGMWGALLITVQRALWKIQAATDTGGLPAQHPLFQILADQRHDISVTFLMTAIFGTITLVSIGLALTLRAAGPIHRLQNHLNEIVQGQTLEDVAFRKEDYFPELAEVFNRHMEHYRKLQSQLNDFRSKKSA